MPLSSYGHVGVMVNPDQDLPFDEEIRIGTQLLDKSHHLGVAKGVAFCWTRGCCSQSPQTYKALHEDAYYGFKTSIRSHT